MTSPSTSPPNRRPTAPASSARAAGEPELRRRLGHRRRAAGAALPVAVAAAHLRAGLHRRRATATVLLLATALLAGCGRAGEGFVLDREVTAGRYQVGNQSDAGLQLASEPAVESVEVGDERRRSVVTGVEPWRWRGRLPAGARLSLGAQLVPVKGVGWTQLEVTVALVADGEREIVEVGRIGAPPAGNRPTPPPRQPPPPGPRWLDLTADLSRHAGRRVTLEVTPRLASGRAAAGRSSGSTTAADSGFPTAPATAVAAASSAGGSGSAALTAGRPDAAPAAVPRRVAWSAVSLSGDHPSRPADARPNIVFILVDTLRADRLTPYGYERDTSPQIARHLAEPGVVVETAYSQAPWTLPSMVSLMSGVYPGELLGASDPAAYGLPDGLPVLAELLQAAGYETAAFYGNYILRDGNGFGRGFATRYTPLAHGSSNLLHAESINQRALPWIAAHQHASQPFFLYLHYMDPHDPYDNADIVDNRSPFEAEPYTGPLTGEMVHGVWIGRLPLTAPQQDVAHLSALYDAEVAYVDRHLGQLLSALAPEVAANTLFVLTADHGEELFDHGGFKHGYTLYDEQIHVPLLLRWDGRIAAGRRLAGTVRLLDLAPTLATAAGVEAPAAWEGTDLLPALTGEAPLPRRPAFAQHLINGPLRAAVVFDDHKLILFNRQEPFEPENAVVEHLWGLDLERMERRELYDLAADPDERRNRAAEEGEVAAALEPILHHRLDRGLPGFHLLASGLAPGQSLELTLELAEPPADWHPYFLAAGDGARWRGPRLELRLDGAANQAEERGVWLPGSCPAVEGLTVRLDGDLLPAGRIVVGEGSRYRGGGVQPGQLQVTERPPRPEGAALRLYCRELPIPGGEGELDPEVERSLRALGYIQ